MCWNMEHCGVPKSQGLKKESFKCLGHVFIGVVNNKRRVERLEKALVDLEVFKALAQSSRDAILCRVGRVKVHLKTHFSPLKSED